MTRTLSLLVPAALVATALVSLPTPGAADAGAGRRASAESAPMPRAKKPRPAGALEYNRDIRPILAENCFACHGPDSAARKAELRLDQRDDGHRRRRRSSRASRTESELIRPHPRPRTKTEMMPPPKTHKKLTAAQKETLKKWIAEGAEYQPHWSFIAPTRPKLPEVKDKAWVRNPIDAFVLAELEKRGLKPAPGSRPPHARPPARAST